ncbi:transcriptional regulator, HxlR family [Pseudomonas sp. NFACC49-2]|uniref:winged helix-turn-helix transcriptional regulator n=1 Tax=Pseudomonas TaxID=286 RepID=UPI0009156FD6|nr:MULTISPECIES: helix-turn-helix domain-containing protein [Pseudomonas]MDT8907241.1 helix-turn-helix domain-containing protein [Pseudomonas prosekii]NHN69957.1 helix-turn-helix transcriptional regulator [Pseudomonas fluorescens]SFX51145.1 transcriptional regulator, HxlR family [Pseudomonas sp. NFACC49-2]
MTQQTGSGSHECPVARAVEVIGDRWSLLIVRDAFDDVRRFSEFQKNLGLAKNILASRLKALVEVGVLETRPASDGSAYKEYVLTQKGREVFPIVVSLRQWGERHLFKAGETYSVLLDNERDEPVALLEVRSLDGRKLEAGDCHRRRVAKA